MAKQPRWGQVAGALVDQGFASASAFLAVLVVAGVLSSGDFGIFAFPYTALTLFVGVGRAFFGVPLAVTPPEGRNRVFGGSVSAILVASPAVVLVVGGTGVLGAVLGGELSPASIPITVSVAVATPLLMLVDVCRYAQFARRRYRSAAGADAVWLGGIFVLLTVRTVIDSTALLTIWVLIIAACAAVHLLLTRPVWSGREGFALLRPGRRLRDSLALTVILTTGVTLLMGLMMLPALGAAAVGAIRGAGTLFGPINTLISLLDLAVVGSIARRPAPTRLRFTLAVTAALSFVSLCWWLVLFFLPPAVGDFLLGDTWLVARSILGFTGVEYVFICAAAGLSVLLKVRAAAWDLLINRMLASVVILGAASAFLLAGADVRAMALALLLGAIVSLVHVAAVIAFRRPAESAQRERIDP